MVKKHKYDIIVILSVLALCVSVYLSIAKALSLAVPCDFTGGCETVLSSKYSMLLGLPLSTWGIFYFSLLIITSLFANHYNNARKALKLFLALGTLGSLSFLSIQFFVLKAVCQYCLLTDSLTIVMFLWDLNLEFHQKPNVNSSQPE